MLVYLYNTLVPSYVQDPYFNAAGLSVVGKPSQVVGTRRSDFFHRHKNYRFHPNKTATEVSNTLRTERLKHAHIFTNEYKERCTKFSRIGAEALNPTTNPKQGMPNRQD